MYPLLLPPDRSALLFAALGLDTGEDAVGFGAPVGAADKRGCTLRAEQAFIGEIGYPGLALGRCFRRPRREADLAHGFCDLANFFAAAAAVFDHALEEISSLLFPVDARKSLLERGEYRILDAVGACGGESFDHHRLHALDHYATAHLDRRGDAEFPARHLGVETQFDQQRRKRLGAAAS